MRRTLAVIGHGMVANKLVETLVADETSRRWTIVVFGEEPRPAYDRMHLSTLFEGSTAADLDLSASMADHPGVVVHLGDPVLDLDPVTRIIRTEGGRSVAYDEAVLATGSAPFVPPVEGCALPGCFVYRTIEDVDAIRRQAERAATGLVVGGGLLGLEAAGALRACGLDVHIVELAPHLMPVQVDEVGGSVLSDRIEHLGVSVHVESSVTAVLAGPDGSVEAVRLGGTSGSAVIDTQLVVWAAGIRPRDEVARRAGLQVGERGGVVVDERCRTSDKSIFAIGECALAADGRVHGLVSPGYQMARVVATVLAGRDAKFAGGNHDTTLKLLGVEVASFGDRHAPGNPVVYTDRDRGVYRKVVVDSSGRIVSGVLVGDTTGFEVLVQMTTGNLAAPSNPGALVAPQHQGDGVILGVDGLGDAAGICSCEGVSKGAICRAVSERFAAGQPVAVQHIKSATGAGTGCGGCLPLVTDLVRSELAKAGVPLANHLCEHFSYSRQDLFDILRTTGTTTFKDLLVSHGRGRGCEICRPAVASMLASMSEGYILDGERASLQDTNDHFLANMQRNGTYSVIPRIPGGEITPEGLIAIGEVAREFNLYSKITGAQRIDLLGARVEQLPAIWRRLINAGFESGHAYGKALRTVKSCVGTTWCRYGVQDSVAMAIDLELRYRGLRAPHKVKMAVSGCSRECAEAQGKDVGLIATEKGWNLYVCGNGGMRPRHADLLAADLDPDSLVRIVDRFLMYYIRTADRLQRTSVWLEKLDGGLDHLRRVIIDDCLGICPQLEADMERHVASYQCEWKATLEDPIRLRRFRTFVNSDAPDGDIVFVTERGQPRPGPAGSSWEPVELVTASR